MIKNKLYYSTSINIRTGYFSNNINFKKKNIY